MKKKIKNLSILGETLNNEIIGTLISFNYKNYILSMMCESTLNIDEDILETQIKYVMAIKNFDFSSMQLAKFDNTIIKSKINPVSTMVYTSEELVKNLILKENILRKQIDAITFQIDKLIIKDTITGIIRKPGRKQK
jgi:hypothetical protein